MSGSAKPGDLHVPAHPVRFVTAAALFDGHDAAINIMRRLLQAQGAEVIHLGHNRSVDEVVNAALEEDAQGVAISSYQGGHVEYFQYLVDRLRSSPGPGRCGSTAAAAASSCPTRSLACESYGVPDLLARGRPAARPARHDQRADRASATATWPPSRPPLEAVLAG